MKVDNFALTMFQACPIKYKLRIQDHWTSRRKSSALGFGGALHEGLAAWYRTGEQTKALSAIGDSWPENLPIDDWRTKEKCLKTMMEYMKTYPVETFQVIGRDTEDPMVECTFTLSTGLYLACESPGCNQPLYSLTNPLCSVCGEPREEIEYGGIFDTLVEFNNNIYVLEHKTTSRLGSYYFNQFKPNNQVTGYIWGGGLMSGQRVGGAIINAIGLYKSSATKFERQITSRSHEEISEWLIHIHSTCQQIRDCERRNYWPMYTGSCTMYGQCEYHSVHVLGTENERSKRLSTDFIQEAWEYENREGVK